MNVQELYNYITAKMTPEEALMKLLEASIVNYEKLKFNAGEELHPEMLIAMAAMDRGWNLAIPAPENEGSDEEVQGMIVGTSAYVDELVNALEAYRTDESTTP
jgi:hypothetical protein